MKVLFISSGNSKAGISPIVKNQGESLKKSGNEVDYFTIKGKGIKGYLKNIKPLKRLLKENKFDIIHSHYSMSAFVASLAGAKPLVVSLMGSDVKSDKYFQLIIKIFNKLSWDKAIVKSEDMKASLGINDVDIIPNGVDFEKFKPLDKIECKKELNWDISKQQILFAANPNRPEKNHKLAKDSIELLKNPNIELKVLKNVPSEKMPIYHNAADIILLTSLWEGSPNVIKEAMACKRPIVSTNVGDVEWLFGNEQGHFLTDFDVKEVADNMQRAIDFSSKYKATTGRDRIKELELDSVSVAKRIVQVYNAVLNKRN